MQIVIELTYFATPDCGVGVSFHREEVLSHLREMAGRSKSESAVFTLTGHRDKLPDHLSALAGVPIN